MEVSGDMRNHYIARMDWAENSNELMLQQLNRLQNTNRVMLANAHSGDVKTIFTDRDDAWVEVRFGFTKWIDNGKRFTFVSERDGWRHVYLVSRDGKTVQRITSGKYDVTRVLGVDEKSRWLYFIASPNNPAQRFLYRIDLDGNGLNRLSPEKQAGSHSYNISPDTQWAVHSFSSFAAP